LVDLASARPEDLARLPMIGRETALKIMSYIESVVSVSERAR
jgi:DNA uptake protein ComE-like DNA-binding protein